MEINWSTLLGIALWALIPGFIAKKKGRSFAGYFFLSFLITPLITTIVTLCVKNLNSPSESAEKTKSDSVDSQNS